MTDEWSRLEEEFRSELDWARVRLDQAQSRLRALDHPFLLRSTEAEEVLTRPEAEALLREARSRYKRALEQFTALAFGH